MPKRTHTVSFRMNDEEYHDFCKIICKTGATVQSYCICSVLQGPIALSVDMEEKNKRIEELEEQVRQLEGK
jgi:hypothetical protein